MICQQNCSICKHPLLEEINEMKKAGKTLRDIVTFIDDKSDTKITNASLSRHYAKKREIVSAEVNKMEIENLKREATDILTYQKWTNKLLDRTFTRIWEHFDNMNIDISDLERLAKLRVLLKEGDSSIGDNIIDVFDQAAKKYNINVDQGLLFQTEPKNPIKNAIDVEISPLPCNQG